MLGERVFAHLFSARFSVFISMSACGQAIIYTRLSPWERCKLVVKRLIDE